MNDDTKTLREELEDRLNEQALGEVLSGKKPPDLSARISEMAAGAMATVTVAPVAEAATAVASTIPAKPVAAGEKPWQTAGRYVLAASLVAAVWGIGYGLGKGYERKSAVLTAETAKRVSEINAARRAQSRVRGGFQSNGQTLPSPYYMQDDVQYPLADFYGTSANEVRERVKEPQITQANVGQRAEQEKARRDAERHITMALSGRREEVGILSSKPDGTVVTGTTGPVTAKSPDSGLKRDAGKQSAGSVEVRILHGLHKDLSGITFAGPKNPRDPANFLDKSPGVDGLLVGDEDNLARFQEEAKAKMATYVAVRNQLQTALQGKSLEYREAVAKNEKGDEILADLEELRVELRELPLHMPIPGQGEGPEHRGVNFAHITENAFLRVKEHALSTFSIDVDTAAYAIMRRNIAEGNVLPPPGAVRIEEYLNYFSYDYECPKGEDPFAAHVEVAACPWNGQHRLVRVGLKGKEIETGKRPSSNLVFLLDVSGSMNQDKKLPFVKESMRILLDKLGENDRVAIVVYAGAAGLVLPSTTADKKSDILAALDKLHAGGSTNGAQGIELAYQTAIEHFIKGGTNRVILCTDGDFNVGTTSTDALQRLAEEKAKSGVFLSVLGFGYDNLQDKTLETLADKGNGNYGYIDTLKEANKVFGQQLTGTLITIAKDVKIQIEFNPAQVAAYRLIGYENRILAAEDFNDDKKDAGEIGAGHTVTALYEVVPHGVEAPAGAPAIDKLKYQVPAKLTDDAAAGELMTLKLRYKQPEGDKSKLLEFPVKDAGKKFGQASDDFRFASAVAAYGMLLRTSQHAGNSTFAATAEIAEAAKGKDAHGHRAEFIELVKKAQKLRGN